MDGGRTQFAILSLLRLGAMTGVEIRDLFQTRFSYFWSESFGQLYPTLQRLSRRGLVRRTSDRKAKRNVRFSITDSGHRSLKEWLSGPASPRTVRDELLLMLCCGVESDDRDHCARIEAELTRARQSLGEIRAAQADMKANHRQAPDFRYWLLTLRAGELIGRARIKWCEEALEVLNAKQGGET